MSIKEKILAYLSMCGKENRYRLASALKMGVGEVTKALSALEKEGMIEVKGGRAILLKGKKPILAKARKRKKQPKAEEEQAEETESKEETPAEEEQPAETSIEEEVEKEEPEKVSEEPAEEKVQETFGIKEERIEGSVKFFNINKGFGFITGDDGEEYFVHESGLKEGVTLEPDDRVCFKVVQSDKGPKAEEVEKIAEEQEEETPAE